MLLRFSINAQYEIMRSYFAFLDELFSPNCLLETEENVHAPATFGKDRR